MASRKDRFGGLGASGDTARGPGQTADLFEHYGVTVDPAAQTGTVQALEARPCRRCGWFLALRRDDPQCPLCAEPEPHAAAKTPAAKR